MRSQTLRCPKIRRAAQPLGIKMRPHISLSGHMIDSGNCSSPLRLHALDPLNRGEFLLGADTHTVSIRPGIKRWANNKTKRGWSQTGIRRFAECAVQPIAPTATLFMFPEGRFSV